MNLENIFPHFVTLSLLVLAAVYKSPALGAAVVVALGLILTKEFFDKRYSALTIKTQVPEELKRSIQDMNARIATLEYGVKTRGF